MITKKYVFFFLFFVLLTSVVSGEFVVQNKNIPSPDFTVYSSSQTSVCACGSTVDHVTISNPYEFAQSFLLYSQSNFLSLPTTRVIVEAGNTLSIPYEVLVGCDEKDLSYTILIEGATQTKQITKDLLINQCQNLAVSSIDSLNVGICQKFQSSLRIENIGSFTETYTITPVNHKQYVSTPSQSVTIPAGSFADIVFDYQFACDMSESYLLEYDIRSEKSMMKANLVQRVNISGTYDFDIGITQPDNTCLADKSSFEIIIENRNEFTDYFTVELQGPDFIEVNYPLVDDKETKTIVLPPKTKTSLDVLVSPNRQRDIGEHRVDLTVRSRYAQSSLSASTNITIFDCYSFDNLFVSSPGTISTCGEQEFQRDIQVAHSGLGSPATSFISSSNLVTVKNTSLEFDGQETKNLTLNFNIPKNLTSRNTVTLSAYFRDQIVDQQSFSLFTETNQNCFLLIPIKDRVNLYESSKYFELPVLHVGDQANIYDVELLDAPAYVSLLTNEMGISPGTRDSLLFAINRSILIEDAIIYNDGNILGLKGQVSISLASTDEKSMYKEEFEIRFVDRPFYEKLWSGFIALDLCFMIFIVLVVLVLLFGIVGVIKTVHHEHFRSNNVLLLVCTLICVVAAVYVFFTVGPPTNPYIPYDLNTGSSTYIRMVQDQASTLDLDQFFFDPDDNLVEFGVASYIPRHLNFSQDNASITLRSQEDFVGNTTISLYVIDAFDETAVSPDIIVEVLPKKEFSIGELFFLLCEYINLAVLFILLFVIYVTFSFRKHEKEKQLTIQEAEEELPYEGKTNKKKSKKNKK